MKKLMVLAALVLATMSCSRKPHDTHCDAGSCDLPPNGGAPQITDVVAEDNWSFIMTGEGWETMQPPDGNIKVIFANQEHRTMVMFAKDPLEESSTEYIMDSLRAFKAASLDIQEAKQEEINGVKYIYISAHGENRHAWSWIATKNNFGYVLTCATVKEDAGGVDDQFRCQAIAKSLRIN